jgi:hypothetical protein
MEVPDKTILKPDRKCIELFRLSQFVMAGLVPAIHVFLA